MRYIFKYNIENTYKSNRNTLCGMVAFDGIVANVFLANINRKNKTTSAAIASTIIIATTTTITTSTAKSYNALVAHDANDLAL